MMNIADIVIIVIVVILFLVAIRKLYVNFKCMNKGGGCAGCTLSGNCHKQLQKQKQVHK